MSNPYALIVPGGGQPHRTRHEQPGDARLHPHSKRWVNTGKIINSAGVSAGIDMALFLISCLTDEGTARQVQLAIHYDPQPPFGDIDYDHLPAFMCLTRGWMNLSAAFAARKPRQMLQQGL